MRNLLKMLFELPDSTLDKIMELSDQDKDGLLDRYEYNVACHLTDRAYDGDSQIPDQVVKSHHSPHSIIMIHYSFPLSCPERTLNS